MQTSAVEHVNPPSGEGPELDFGILDDQRDPVPVPGHLPQPWQAWIAESQQTTGAPADYILQATLAAVAGLCGAGVRVRVTLAPRRSRAR